MGPDGLKSAWEVAGLERERREVQCREAVQGLKGDRLKECNALPHWHQGLDIAVKAAVSARHAVLGNNGGQQWGIAAAG